MNTRLVLALAPLLIGLTGCQGSLHGDWHFVSAQPNRETFSLDNVAFRPDGTYSALTCFDGRVQQENGTWDFSMGKLRLRPQGGGARGLTATVTLDRLELRRGKDLAVLRKGKRGGTR